MNDSLKRNTQSIQALVDVTPTSEAEKPTKSEKSPIEKDLKDLSSVLSKMMSPESPLSKIAKAMEESSSKPVDFTKTGEIKGAFQTGGVAKQEGNYVVGENGPEVVKLPKGSGIIPINTKDLIEGLKKVPELSALLKEGDVVNVTGEYYDKSILSSDGKRISLNKLINKYEDETFFSDDETKDKKTAERLEKNLKSLEDLQKAADDKLNFEFNSIREEKMKLDSQRGGAEPPEQFEEKLRISKDILKTLPPEEHTELAVAKARLEAEKIILAKSLERSEAKPTGKTESSETAVSKTDLKKLNTEAKTSESKSESEKPGKEKGPGVFSKLGSQLKKSAGRVAEGVADKTGISGILSVGKKALESRSEKNKSEKSSTAASSESKGEPSEMKRSVPALAALPPKPEPKPEPPKTEAPKPPKPVESKKESVTSASSEPASAKSTTPSRKEEESKESITPADLNDIKSALARIASLLEGPITVSSMDGPFRPDSRRV
jgi:hypothetical protein